MSDTACLALLLDGPLQSWGFASRFQRRTTGLHPTKSGVIGLIFAAMGLPKGSDEEKARLQQFEACLMHVVFLPRPRRRIVQPQPGSRTHWLEPRRMDDYHTVGGGWDAKAQPWSMPWTASGEPDKDATETRREYLLDARFGIILVAQRELLIAVARALRDPVWGIWLGRKSCIPAAPVLAGEPFPSNTEAWLALLAKVDLPPEVPYAAFGGVEEVALNDGGLAIRDQPVSFCDGRSSGPEKRMFAVRRIASKPGISPS